MAFWSFLFGRKKPVAPVQPPKDIAPEPVVDTVPTLEEVEAQVEALIRDIFPGAIESHEADKKAEEDALAEKKRKRSEAAKKAAATRAANKAKKQQQ
jgi:hypothetical protein